MGNFRKLSVVLLLAFVLLCCCAVSAFAENYTVTVNSYDSNRQLSAFDGDASNLYVFLEVKDTNNPYGTKAVFWLYQQVEGKDDAPHKTNYSVELDGTQDSLPTETGIVGYESSAWTATFIHLPGVSDSGHTIAFTPITFKPEHLGKCIPDSEKGYVCNSKDYHYTLTESGNAVGIINSPALKFIIRVSEAEDGPVQADFVDESGNILSADRILAAMTFTNTIRSYTAGEAEIAVEKVFSEAFTNRKIEQETPEGPTFHRIETMPRTGFSSLRPSVLKERPKDLFYRPMAFTLQIPSLDITADIVEVPFADGEYPVEWLGSSPVFWKGTHCLARGRLSSPGITT